MGEGALFLVFCVILNRATTQTIDYITPQMPVPNPCTISTPTYNSKWEELLPALKMMKSSSTIKKERLLNVVKIIKFLLSDQKERKECDQILEDIKETNEFPYPEFIDIESIVNERLKPIEEAIDGNVCVPEKVDVVKEVPVNKTEDFSKILAKISAALAKVKENNENPTSQKPSVVMPIFRSMKSGCKNELNQPLFEALGQISNVQVSQAGVNSMSSGAMFNIPCQRAADILEETASFVVPKDAYCDLPANINLNSILKNPKVNSDNLPFKVVPNSIACFDSDETIAMLFKPKKISFMQVYGNLLKKITITVLVPYFVSKIPL